MGREGGGEGSWEGWSGEGNRDKSGEYKSVGVMRRDNGREGEWEQGGKWRA